MHQPWMIGVARVPLTGEFVYVYFIGIAYHMLWGKNVHIFWEEYVGEV